MLTQILMNNIVHAFFHILESFFWIHCALDISSKYYPRSVCSKTPTNSQEFFSSSHLAFYSSWTTFWFLASFSSGCLNFFHNLIGRIILGSLQSSKYLGLVYVPYSWCNSTQGPHLLSSTQRPCLMKLPCHCLAKNSRGWNTIQTLNFFYEFFSHWCVFYFCYKGWF